MLTCIDIMTCTLYNQVGAGDGKTVSIWIQAVALGQIPIQVKAQSVAAADAVRRMLLVEVRCRLIDRLKGWS